MVSSGFAAVWSRFEERRYGAGGGSTAIPKDLPRVLRAFRRALLAQRRQLARASRAGGLNPRGGAVEAR